MIKASGQHHEGHATGNRNNDADYILSDFLDKLRASGHQITVASFSAGDTTHMLVGSPKDVNNIDELYGISSNVAEDDTAEDIGSDVSLADILNEIQGLREEHMHTHQTLVSFIDYEKDEDSDDAKAAKKRSKPRGKKNEGGGAPTAEPKPEDEQAAQEADADPYKEAPEQEQTQPPSESTDSNTAA